MMKLSTARSHLLGVSKGYGYTRGTKAQEHQKEMSTEEIRDRIAQIEREREDIRLSAEKIGEIIKSSLEAQKGPQKEAYTDGIGEA